MGTELYRWHARQHHALIHVGKRPCVDCLRGTFAVACCSLTRGSGRPNTSWTSWNPGDCIVPALRACQGFLYTALVHRAIHLALRTVHGMCHAALQP